jgi:hypothetical protein
MLVPASEDDGGTHDTQIEQRVNWLSDLDMLPSEIPGARIMCYSYKTTTVEVPSPRQYLTVRTEDLLTRIIQKRTSDSVDYGNVPIVLIGLGFGSLILHSALHFLATPSRIDLDSTTVLDLIAGIILLDAPSPSPDRAKFPRSQSQERRKAWTLKWLGKQHNTSIPPTMIDIRSVWSQFSQIALLCNISLVWHYSLMIPSAGKVSSQRNPLDMHYTLTAVYLACCDTSEPRGVIHSQTVCNRAPSQQIRGPQ